MQPLIVGRSRGILGVVKYHTFEFILSGASNLCYSWDSIWTITHGGVTYGWLLVSTEMVTVVVGCSDTSHWPAWLRNYGGLKAFLE